MENIDEREEKMENITTLFISLSALLTAIVTLVNNIIKSKKEIEDALPRKIPKQSSIDMEITNKMEELKEFVQADRVQIYDFHNRSDIMQMEEVL